MNRLHKINFPEDFQARIRIFTTAERGRVKPTFNGIRWDFKYFDNVSNLYMIWPDFFDNEGNSFPAETLLPVNQWLNARMYIVVDEMREKVHRLKVQEGVKFYCMEGSRHTAEGIVSKIVGLYETRP
jgi:hypothetical protein